MPPRGTTIVSWRADLAGVPIEIRTRRTELGERFAAFATAREPRLTIVDAPVREGGSKALPGLGPPLEIDGRRRVLADLGGDPPGINVVVKSVLPGLVAPALVLHAALLGDGGRGFLCCGFSGAGKSTLSRLLSDRAYGEELAVARIDGDGLSVEAVPIGRARPGILQLAGIVILRHGARTASTRIEPGDAVREVARHVYWPSEDPAALAGAFDTLDRVVARIPVRRLAFRPEPAVWRIIAGGP